MLALPAKRVLLCIAASGVLVSLLARAAQPAVAMDESAIEAAPAPIAALTRWHDGQRELLLVNDGDAGAVAIYDARTGAPLNRPNDGTLASAR